MISPIGMETFEARLQSFKVAHAITKTRTSNAKSAGKLKWPHKSPDPAQLAWAGFFYNPTASRPDNTTCYLCRSTLDGWEEDDSAIGEHLSFSPHCGWAAIARIEQDIEDGNLAQHNPMDERLLSARKMTFGVNWPHEDKRGWVCKTQKMIEAGWYYCPTSESDDFVKCCYCNLSLAGWEPKDDPYHEHQRRSPDCMFFALSQPSRKKAVRGNKGRGSKGSRMSTQSNLTTASEDISMIDVDMNEGASVSKQELELLTSFKATKGAKKGVKGKKAAPKSKRKVPTEHQEELVPGSSFVEPEDDDFEIKVEQKPSPTTTGEKRKSDHMSVDADSMQPEMKHDQPQPQIPPPKRRATRSSVSRANKAANRISDTSQDENSRMTDAESMPPPLLTVSKKAAKGGKKRGSSNARKASAASTASKASLRAAIPDDEEIDAALEADLDRPLTDDEIDSDPPTVRKTKTRRLTRTKPGSRNITASIAPVGRATSASALPVEGESMASVDASVSDSQMGVVEESKAVEIALTAIDHAKQELIAETDKHMASKAKTRGRPRSKTTKAARKGKTTEQDSHNIKNSEAIPQVSPLPTRPPQVPESEQKSVQLPGITARMSDVSVESLKGEQAIEVDSSVLAPSVVHEISAVEAQDGHASQNRVKKGGKPRGAAAKKGKAVKKGVAASQSNRSIIQIETEDPGRNDPAVLVGVETLDDHENAGEPTWLMVAPAKDVAKSKVKGTKGEKRTVESSRKSDTRLSSEASSVSRAEPVKVPSVATQEHIAVAGIPTPADSRGQDDGHKVSVRSPTPPVQPPSGHRTPKTVNSPQSSDAENQPPSSRPSALRPPLLIQTPSKMHTARVPLAVTTPAASPSKRNISRLQTSLPWTSIDFDQILKLPAADKENVSGGGTGGLEQGLSSPEKKLTVEEWIRWNAKRGEDQLREDCERLVGKFEDQGVRALNTLEGIVCAE